jgi:nucleoside-triphosphatase
MSGKNILLTGAPGVGKTTMIMRVLDVLCNVDAGGFYTREIRENGTRAGFKILTLDGREGILSHVNHESRYQVGRYGVNLADLDNIAVNSILDSLERGVIVIDEIGKMELLSEKFKEAAINALDTGRVLGTIKLSPDEFTERIRKRSDTSIVEVTLQNRDALVSELAGKIVKS